MPEGGVGRVRGAARAEEITKLVEVGLWVGEKGVSGRSIRASWDRVHEACEG